MILAIISIATFGNLVWAHHMFTVGLEVETSIYFTIATLIIAVPTGTKLYNWLSMYTANLTPLINIILFLFFCLPTGLYSPYLIIFNIEFIY
jgi:cytochrome c oxidase subunit 1